MCNPSGNVYVWAVNQQTPARLTPTPVGWFDCLLSWSHDGALLFAGMPRGFRIWDMSILPPVLTGATLPEPTGQFKWSPDGHWFAGTKYVYSVDDNYAVAGSWWPVGADGATTFYPTWLPDNRNFLVDYMVGETRTTSIVEARTGRGVGTPLTAM